MALADELNALLEENTIAEDLFGILSDIEQEQNAKVFITSSGNSVVISCDYPYRYPFQDGELIMPKNTVYYILEDETDYITFRSAADTEVLFTAHMSKLYVDGELATIENLEILFGLTGGGGSGSTDICDIHWIGSDEQYHDIEDIKECVIYLITDEGVEPEPKPEPEKEKRVIDGEYYCNGTDKYKYQLHQERETGKPWVTTSTTSVLVEAECVECGYIPPTPTGSCSILYYTTTDNEVVHTGQSLSIADANIISNTYENGIGKIVFDACPTIIKKNAFQGLPKLKTVILPTSIKRVENDAFYNCEALESITLNEGLEWIGGSVFMHDTSLTSITIPSSVIHIDEYAFWDCASLKEIYTYMKNVPEQREGWGFSLFKNVGMKGTLYYPEGSDYSTWLYTKDYWLGQYSWKGIEIKLND